MMREGASSSRNGIAGEVLPAVEDRYGGVVAEMNHPMDPPLFSSLLRSSLFHWKLQGKKGVWIKLPTQLIGLAEIAIKEGFWMHHAEADYLMLVCWIAKGENALPANASHRVGIGAFVMNNNREVLVVQEKTGRFCGQGFWKFPTGVVNEGEDISVAAVREVKEETGIDTEFVEVLAFRQSHKIFFGKSDLFFLCMLKPLTSEIQAQESEIEAAEWMPWDEYVNQPLVQSHELWRYIVQICHAKTNKDYTGFTPVPVSVPDQPSLLYLNPHHLHPPQ
ncbi:PREDICTED: nudix hydrolase 2 [Tarenaya hassleriana]|uniref:nudix hydrolase 2 n=1 Tax=Tarenaya hassleriana TaxID=28532 RepID=UPI00053C2E23|nr:PREDICTED: nudix hydrolase 2 [Tarenaya hassleriana]